jgi:hypothetical protein
MGNAFILKSALSRLEIIDEIDERLVKAQSLTATLLGYSHPEEVEFRTIYGTIWILDDLLEELNGLLSRLVD